MSLDEAIKRRLTADGDGHGDDRRIQNLARLFCTWTQEDDLQSTSAETQFKVLESTIAAVHLGLEKNCRMNAACQADHHYYESLGSKTEESIEETRKQIAECKMELQEAKQIRKHRQEYDVLAGLIQEHPDRHDTLKKLDEVKQEIDAAAKRKAQLEEKLETRRRQFHVLLTSLAELETIIKAEKDGDEEKMDIA